jgi:hypothetical protein
MEASKSTLGPAPGRVEGSSSAVGRPRSGTGFGIGALHRKAGLIDAYDGAVIQRRADRKVKIVH